MQAEGQTSSHPHSLKQAAPGQDVGRLQDCSLSSSEVLIQALPSYRRSRFMSSLRKSMRRASTCRTSAGVRRHVRGPEFGPQ